MRNAILAGFTALCLVVSAAQAASTPAGGLATITAQSRGAGMTSFAFDGVIEAVRSTVIASRVPGAVVELFVRPGDRVKAGQILVRIDARAAEQSAAAFEAQVQAARAALDVASREYARQKQLANKNYISQAALERAEAEFKSKQAEVNAHIAQANEARTQSGFHVVRAPYAGVIAEVPVSLGDMAMPGRPLLTLYDPAVLRVTAAVPQTVAVKLPAGQLPKVDIPGLPGAVAKPPVSRAQVLPTVDPSTHTVQVRAELLTSAANSGLTPGMFARLSLPVLGPIGAGSSPLVPQQAIVRRGEMTGLYVLDSQGKPILRQVRLGHTEGDQVEVLSGLNVGERVATDPQAAARVR